MKNFNELFEEAATVSDKRKSIFNQLIEKTVSEILPKFCEACQSLDISRVYFSLDSCPNRYCDKQQYDFDSYTYGIAFDTENKTFCDAKVTPECNWNFEVPEHWDWLSFDTDTHHFTRVGIVELVRSINNRLENYIKKYEKKNTDAQKLIHS